MCLRWRRHDDGRWSRGDIYDVIVHRVSLLTKSSTSIAFIFIPSQCPAHLETWRWAHVHLSPNVERPIKHYTLTVHIIHKREVINHLRYSHHKISIHFRHFLQMQSSQCHFILHCFACFLRPCVRMFCYRSGFHLNVKRVDELTACNAARSFKLKTKDDRIYFIL